MGAITATTAAWIAVASTAASTAISLKSSADQKKSAKKADEKAEQASALESKSSEVENARQRRMEIARRRIKAAEMAQSADTSGVGGGSGVAGAAGAMSTNLGSALGSSNTRQAAAFGAQGLRNDAQSILTNSQFKANNMAILSGGIQSFGDLAGKGVFGRGNPGTDPGSLTNGFGFNVPARRQAGSTQGLGR